MTHDELQAEAGDGIMPSQWNDIRGARLQMPEKRLALAVLEDGIRCYQGGAIVNGGKCVSHDQRVLLRQR